MTDSEIGAAWHSGHRPSQQLEFLGLQVQDDAATMVHKSHYHASSCTLSNLGTFSWKYLLQNKSKLYFAGFFEWNGQVGNYKLECDDFIRFLNNSLPGLRPRLLHNEFESSICAQLTCNCCKFGMKLKLTFQRVYLRKWNCVCGILFWVVALFLQIRTSFLSLFGACLSSTGKFPERPPSVFAKTNRLFSVFFRRYDALG